MFGVSCLLLLFSYIVYQAVCRQNVGKIASKGGFEVEFEVRRGVREAYGAALEKRSLRKRSVGSNPTLSATYGENLRRGAGVDYQARLESACSLGYRGFESHPLRQISSAYD